MFDKHRSGGGGRGVVLTRNGGVLLGMGKREWSFISSGKQDRVCLSFSFHSLLVIYQAYL